MSIKHFKDFVPAEKSKLEHEQHPINGMREDLPFKNFTEFDPSSPKTLESNGLTMDTVIETIYNSIERDASSPHDEKSSLYPFEHQPNSARADNSSNDRDVEKSDVPIGSTVEGVVKQHNLERKPSPQQYIQFDFNQFLQQVRSPGATQIARYVKNFGREFERRPWSVNDQIKIINDFLNFISVKMRDCELWRDTSDAEFENAKEGMEKLVMNRLYKLIFTPVIKGHVLTDDRERDEILHQKIQIFRWVKEEHLEITRDKHNEQFLEFAKNELLKINYFKAPRDKLICILNCCKVIFGLIKHVDGEAGADKFLPILIFVVLRANPDHLVSNVQYIYRFRNPEKLQSEAGYYLSSLMGAISFIENMDASSLIISKADFDSKIGMTMRELERERPNIQENKREVNYDTCTNSKRHSLNIKPSILNSAQARAFFEKGGIFAQKSFQMPLNFVGRIFAEVNNSHEIKEPLSTRRINNFASDVNSSSESSSRSASPLL